VKISFVTLFLIFLSFNLNAHHEGGFDKNETIGTQSSNSLCRADKFCSWKWSNGLQNFLEGKTFYGYFQNKQEFESKYFTLNSSLDEYGQYKLGPDHKGDYLFKSNGKELTGKWWIDNTNDICYEINGDFSGCAKLMTHHAGDEWDESQFVFYFINPKSKSITAKIIAMEQFSENLETKTNRLLEEEWKKEKEEKEENELKTGVKLVKAYANYIMLKNLNDTYGSSKELNNAKKHIKFIEDYYKDKVEIDIDTLWEQGKARYQKEYSRSAEIFASDYSAKGLKAFKVLKRELLDEANDNGFSSSNTDKDF